MYGRRVLTVLRAIYALGALLVAIVGGMVCGTVFALPFIVLPRGRRERHSIRAATVFSAFVLRTVLFHRLEVTGDSGLSADQGALFICNHRSWLDPVVMMGQTRSQGLSKDIIKYIPFIGIYGWLTGAVYFDRRSPRDRQRAREEVCMLLRSGARIHMFPEGTRSRSGELAERVFLTLPKDCFAQGIPVVPCAVWGTENTLPVRGVAAFPFQSSRLHVGRALQPADFHDADAFADACWARVRQHVTELREREGMPGAGFEPALP